MFPVTGDCAGSKLFTVKIIHKRVPNASPIIEGLSLFKIIVKMEIVKRRLPHFLLVANLRFT